MIPKRRLLADENDPRLEPLVVTLVFIRENSLSLLLLSRPRDHRGV